MHHSMQGKQSITQQMNTIIIDAFLTINIIILIISIYAIKHLRPPIPNASWHIALSIKGPFKLERINKDVNKVIEYYTNQSPSMTLTPINPKSGKIIHEKSITLSLTSEQALK